MCTSVTKHNSYTIHLHINNTDAVKPAPVAAVSVKQSRSVYNTCLVASTMVYYPVNFCSFSKLDILKAINPLRPSQSVAIDFQPVLILNF